MSLRRRHDRAQRGPRDAVGEPFVRLAALAASRERHGTGPSTYEERAGLLITKAAGPEGLDRQRLDWLWQRLAPEARVRESLPSGWTARPARRWVLVVGALLLSTGGGLVAAETGVWQWPAKVVRTLTGDQAAVVAPPVSTPRASRARPVASQELWPSPAPETSPPEVAPPVERREPRRRPERKPTPPEALPLDPPVMPTAPSLEPSALAAESALLARALASLRQGRDPAAALRELDQYALQFPGGLLGREAQAARVDALLLAGRSTEAGRALAGLHLGDGARDLELRLIRAELSAASGACASALGDFQRVLQQGKASSLVERALWGSAACHRRLGDEPGARAALSTYLARFPDGPRAAAARAGVAR